MEVGNSNWQNRLFPYKYKVYIFTYLYMNALTENEGKITEGEITEGEIGSTGELTLTDVNSEAKNRLAQIIENIGSRLGGEEYCKIIRYELQEISGGKSITEEEMVINMEELHTILYSPNIEKKEIRRIIANIARRARIAVERSTVKARENRKKLGWSAKK